MTVIIRKLLAFILTIIIIWMVFMKSISFTETTLLKRNLPVLEPVRNTKTILFWTSFFGVKDFNFGLGNKPFYYHQCDFTECYITDNKSLLPVDQFDAIIFHGPNIYDQKQSVFPSTRSGHQIYAYFSQESPANHPVESYFNSKFNITMTYRIDSDIPVPYFHIADSDNINVSPSTDPIWKQPINNIDIIISTLKVIEYKRKPVAWFSSHCRTHNKREAYIQELQKYISVDIYGACGPLRCSRSNENLCFEMLSKDYFFYLSFENSNCVDYITEKVLTALQHDVIPVVLGGANLTRFIPPGSYIDAREISPDKLVRKMKHLMNNPLKYLEYFWWKRYYKVGYSISPFCLLCGLLHDVHFKGKTYANLQQWWHGTKNNPVCTSANDKLLFVN